MPTHYHLLFYQAEQGTVAEIMRAVVDGYTRYYNKKYDRRGPVFTGRYRASRIDSDAYLLQASRYVHQNPEENIIDYKWSSLNCFVKGKDVSWVRPQRVLDMFPSRKRYIEFVMDRDDMEGRFSELQFWLADSAEMLADKDEARK
jgi:putative transposase